jgi:hypothetical protein
MTIQKAKFPPSKSQSTRRMQLVLHQSNQAQTQKGRAQGRPLPAWRGPRTKITRLTSEHKSKSVRERTISTIQHQPKETHSLLKKPRTLDLLINRESCTPISSNSNSSETPTLPVPLHPKKEEGLHLKNTKRNSLVKESKTEARLN